ncbi:MAG TPA: peptidoglycan DD-metalloendopeptidase family protein [Gammaproteobacteria bacterium]
MRQGGRYPLIALLLAALATAPLTPAATPRQNKEIELKQLRSRIDTLRGDLNRVRSRYDAMRNELRDLEESIATLRRNIAELDDQLAKQAGQLRTLERKQRRIEGKLDEQRDHLARQLRAAYAAGRQEYVKILLNQEDPAAVGRVVTYYDYLHRARFERISAINASLDELTTVKAEMAAETEQLQQLRDKSAAQQWELEASRGKRTSLLGRLKNEISSKDQQLVRLSADEKELQTLISALSRALEDIPPDSEGKAFSTLKGKLGWPVRGPFLANYGSKRNVGSLAWQGVLIGASEGQQVRAISHGRVAFAEWLRGYGLLLIIDHGDGYMSLYGHNQTLYKGVGDWVKGGEVVAAVGSSGGQERNALYFEIRHNGKPANPGQWCRR